MLLCGDFNSTPKSPLLKFLLDSNLDYAALSALVIAGYFEDTVRKRVIPVPLLPQDMNIGTDCTYDVILVQGSESTGKTGPKSGKANSGRADPGKTNSGKANRANLDSGMHSAEKGKSAELEVTQSEFTPMDLEVEFVSEGKPMRTTRSIRGAKGKGRMPYSGVNLGDFPSLLGSSLSATKRGRGEDLDVLKPSLSGDSSVDGSQLSDGDRGRETSGRSSELGYQSRASCNDYSAVDSLESSVNSVTKNPSSSSGGRTGGKDVGSKNAVEKQNASGTQTCVLTHPFKLITAYPISRSHPSTVTTYHQCAFETVDYIFFSPIACGTNGIRKNLTGFNLLKRKVLPSTHTLLDLGPQPHQFLSSDHLLLQATFQFSW